ncbi:MAG TPA: hypothetical protein VMZ92_18450 [Planctomycetota bacterium]|nr:hypothetical protein [Planctomycetota bacterium]
MEEETQQDGEEPLLAPTLTTVFIHALIPIGLGLFLVYRMPEYEDLFGNMGVSLPAFTRALIEFSGEAARHAGAFFGIIGILLAGDGLGYYLLRRYAERVWARVWWGGVFAVECLVLAGVFRSIVLPAWAMAESVGQ